MLNGYVKLGKADTHTCCCLSAGVDIFNNNLIKGVLFSLIYA